MIQPTYMVHSSYNHLFTRIITLFLLNMKLKYLLLISRIMTPALLSRRSTVVIDISRVLRYGLQISGHPACYFRLALRLLKATLGMQQ
jgi:hypothetical protein